MAQARDDKILIRVGKCLELTPEGRAGLLNDEGRTCDPRASDWRMLRSLNHGRAEEEPEWKAKATRLRHWVWGIRAGSSQDALRCTVWGLVRTAELGTHTGGSSASR